MTHNLPLVRPSAPTPAPEEDAHDSQPAPTGARAISAESAVKWRTGGMSEKEVGVDEVSWAWSSAEVNVGAEDNGFNIALFGDVVKSPKV